VAALPEPLPSLGLPSGAGAILDGIAHQEHDKSVSGSWFS